MWLKIPTGLRQNSWLFTSVAEDLVSIQLACRVCGRKCISVTIHLPRFSRSFGETCLFVVSFIAFTYFFDLIIVIFSFGENVFKASSKLFRIFSKPHFLRENYRLSAQTKTENTREIFHSLTIRVKKYEVSKIP